MQATIKQVYDYIDERLEKSAKLLGIDISKYYEPIEEYKGDNVFYSFCAHSTDRQYLANIVKFYDDSDNATKSVLKTILFEFNADRVIKEYNNPLELFNALCKIRPDLEALKTEMDDNSNFKPDQKKSAKFKYKQWKTYIAGIYGCAEYLSKGIITPFDKETGEKKEKEPITVPISPSELFIEPKDENELKKYLLAIRELKWLPGVGSAICYNWLKESGAFWLSKPDIHMMRIVKELTGSAKLQIDCSIPDTRSRLTEEEAIVLYIYRSAKVIGITPFKLDKWIFLYCTGGYFYADSEKTISEKSLIKFIGNR